MEGLKRISPEEAKNYREIDIYDPYVCKKAVAFTLTPSSKQYPASLYDNPWEDVTYYMDLNDNNEYPLMQLLDEWNTRDKEDNQNLTG